MTGIEPQTSGIGSNRSTNLATTTSHTFNRVSLGIIICVLPLHLVVEPFAIF